MASMQARTDQPVQLSFAHLPFCAAIGPARLRECPLPLLSEVMQVLRQQLWSRRFVEFPTPAIRAHDCCDVIRRLQLADGRYLQDSPALALRRHLGACPKIFSIGQCYRGDEVDETHFQQFHMLDLYERDATINDSVNLFRWLVGLFYSGPFESLSIADKVRGDFDVDLFLDGDGTVEFHESLKKLYQSPNETFFALLDRWVCDEIEPLSSDKCLIVSDFPFAAEARAKLKDGSAAVAERVEFQIRGIEVVHLYQDDPDPSAFVDRARDHGHLGPEDEIVRELIEGGVIPRHSAGGAIGLERFCAVCLGLQNIYGFALAPEFLSAIDLPPIAKHM